MNWETRSMALRYDVTENILYISPPDSFKGPEQKEHAEENITSILSKAGDTVKGIMAYLPRHYISAEATLYYKKQTPDIPIALIEDSFFKRMLGNMIFSIGSSNRPLKMFGNDKDAYAWLTQKINTVSNVS
jgi:hypothetical protein